MNSQEPDSFVAVFYMVAYGVVFLAIAAFCSFISWHLYGWLALIMAPLTMFAALVVPVNIISLLVTGKSLAAWAMVDDGAQGCLNSDN